MKASKKLIAIFAKSKEVSTVDFLKTINELRLENGDNKIEPRHFLERVFDEIGEDLNRKSFTVQNRNKTVTTHYMLDEDQMLLVGMRESKSVRKQVLLWLHHLSDKVNELEKQKAERAEASLSFKEQSAALKLSREFEGKETLSHHYSNEADLLNRVILGCTAKSYRSAHQLGKADSLRDTLTPVELEAYTALRKANETYLLDGLTHSERKEKLTDRYKRFYCQRLIEEYERLNG